MDINTISKSIDLQQQGTAVKSGQPPSVGSFDKPVGVLSQAVPNGPAQVMADRNKLNQAVAKANKVAQSFGTYLNFSVDDTTKTVVVKVVDSNTKEVIMQIPPETTLKLMESFDQNQALMVSKKG